MRAGGRAGGPVAGAGGPVAVSAGAPRSSTGRDADRKNPLVRTSWNLKNFPEGCCLKRDDLEEAIQNIIANEFSFMDMQNPGYLINVN